MCTEVDDGGESMCMCPYVLYEKYFCPKLFQAEDGSLKPTRPTTVGMSCSLEDCEVRCQKEAAS